jgi:hypothetical protein
VQVLGIRFCSVSPEARALAGFFTALGMPQMKLDGFESEGEGFSGAIYPAGASWIEIWKQGPGMPEGAMLQVIVDDADAFAAHARAHGIEPQGPSDAHGERIYFAKAPGGLQVAFQSRLAE